MSPIAPVQAPWPRITIMPKLWCVLMSVSITMAVDLAATEAKPQSQNPAGAPAEAIAGFNKDIRPILEKHCFQCHGAKPEVKGDLNLARLTDEREVLGRRRLWKEVAEMLNSEEMPPPGKPQPTTVERQEILTWIASVTSAGGLSASLLKDPGQPMMRRLNRNEYTATVRDLFGLHAKTAWKYYSPPGDEFPKDGLIIDKVTYRHPWPLLPADESDYGFDNIGEVLTLPPHLMEVYLELAEEVVDAVMADTKARRKALPVKLSASRTDAESARANLALLAERAFRRPVEDGEVDRLVELFELAHKSGEPFEAAIKVPLRALLASPQFLFRAERADPNDTREVRPLNGCELASRLSYFIWSSMPDETLMSLARANKLSDPEVIEQQVRRMLRDPKAEALTEHFAMQWLQITGIQSATPDMDLFPAFYTARKIPWGMRTEALVFFDSFLVEDRSVMELLDADFTYLNGYMAEFYGLSRRGPTGKPGFGVWRRHELPEGRRGGVMTLGAVMTVTSNPTRTSPVKRGKWMLEAILGEPPPPPPPDVEQLQEHEEAADGRVLTFRERLEKHRSNPNCAGCHDQMDPLGLVLDNFDVIGRWRDANGKEAIDASSTFKDGRVIQGPAELKNLLRERKADFLRCFTEHLMTYALGRRLEFFDEVEVDQIVGSLMKGDDKLSTVVAAVAQSYPFRYTRVHAKADPASTNPETAN